MKGYFVIISFWYLPSFRVRVRVRFKSLFCNLYVYINTSISV